MAVYVLTSTFGKGEASPKLWSRADLQDYKMWLKICQNWITMRTGGLKRRPGTQFIGELKDSSRVGCLLPFIFSVSQTYMLVWNAGVYRVYALGGRVGTVEVAHPYADADLATLDYDQTNDVLDITHKAYAPRRVKRQSDTSWSIVTVPFRFGPYLPVNDTSTSLTPSATGNPIPKMTSNTTPSGVADSSSNGLGAPWNVFDRDTGTAWHANSPSSEWVSYTFPAAKIIVGYSVTAYAGMVAATPVTDRAPQSWTFEGFDGTNWTVLDSQFAQNNWSAGETRYFRFTNTVSYIGYRLNVTTNNGGSVITVGEMAFTEDMATAPAITITASATTGINNGAGFTAADIGRIVALLGSNAVYRAFVITAVTDTTHVQAKLDDAPLPVAQGTLQWRLGAWGTTPGWPAHVATFEGRKTYARTNAQPSGIWATKTGAYGSFLDFSVANPVKDDDAISFTLNDVNEIAAIAEGSDLLVGTAGAARTMGRDSPNLPFSATNYRQSLASTHGFEAARPVKVGGSAIFVSSFGKALREFVPSDNGVGYVVPDISIKSDHLFTSKVKEMAYAQEPDSVIWAPNGKGELIGSTFEKEQDMAGFHRHILGPDAFVESCGVIPGPDTDRSELWLIVRRVINGVTKRYIERLGPSFDGATDDPADAWYLDCGIRYEGAPTTTVSGLGHLEGKTVSILADGARENDQVVTGGAVSLASGRAATKILVGLSFQSVARTLPSTLSVGDGSGLGRRKKVVNAMVDVMETGSLRVGRDVASAEEIVIRNTSSNLGEAVPLVSGFLTARAATSWTDKGEVTMVADGPFPATIRSLTLALETEP